jgi:hypothetical protein
MKRILFTVLAFVALFSASSAYGWNSVGHSVIGHIADQNLTPKARKMCNRYLGHSLAYYASWMDQWRYTEEYHHTARWHAVGLKNGEFIPGELAGDTAYFGTPLTMDDHGVARLEQLQKAMKDYRHLPDSAVAVNLKCIIHMVGDMHCPSHVNYRGRNQNYYVDFGGGYVQPRQRMKIHTVWDQGAIQATRIWGLTDWVWELDRLSKKEIKEITAGAPLDWFEDNAQRCLAQFELSSTPEEHLEQDFVNKAMPLIETQILYAGYRLAALLNSLF